MDARKDLASLYFVLPDEQFARFPVEPRDASRLLVVPRDHSPITHLSFRDLPSLLRRGDLLVVNDSSVIPARIKAITPNGLPIEVFLLHPKENPVDWRCLVKPHRRLKQGAVIIRLGGTTLTVAPDGEGASVHFPPHWKKPDVLAFLDQHGEVPLPPYFKRQAVPADRMSYQTVFADLPGSVAAPTAGLHFTPSLLQTLASRGISIAKVTLHVGYGTFAPLRDENFATGQLHSEWFSVPDETKEAIAATKRNGGRVIAVGTTSARSLESYAQGVNEGQTQLFIFPGFRFSLVDGLITNFHLPDSSLLLLVAAFLGVKETAEAYQVALNEKYRFYSYGDAMFVAPP